MSTIAQSQSRSRITSAGVDIRSLQSSLQSRVDGEVRFDDGSRAAYSTDSSNYRQVPIAVVVPHTIDAAVEAIAVCAEQDVPVLSRGGGTSLAGQCCNTAVVIDWTKYCNRLVSLDAEARRAVVEPGIILDILNAAAGEFGLMYGPKPATHSHCALGGMMGNNSCGSSAQAYGKTVDNIERLEILTYDGVRMWVGPTSDDEYERMLSAGGRAADLYRGMRTLTDTYADEIRERFPHIPRRVSGYNLDSLLPENGFDVARALIGSESTLITILQAEITLVPVPAARTDVVFGFPSIEDAADAASFIAGHDPLTVEGMDGNLIAHERAKSERSPGLDLLPDGDGWLVVGMSGVDKDDSVARATALVDAVKHRAQNGTAESPSARVLSDRDEQEQVGAVREAALGTSARSPGQPDAWAGWEDAAVPPDRLGDYLRDFKALLDEFAYHDVTRYGHFGQGCVHCRIPFDLITEDGISAYQAFVERAAHLVVDYGGSLSGEHGDGQSRGALLPIMFGERICRAFSEFKALFDPRDRMNPGKVVVSSLPGNPVPAPDGPTDNLRLGDTYWPIPVRTQFSYPLDDNRFDRAVLRCVGVGNCRSHSGGVMCPSYRATGEEEHSTRGRARLLFEMLEGQYRDSPIRDGWRSEAVHDALDLCLACKGCKSDCPVDVDMATYKAEFLSHHYSGRIRPMSHYSMGWLPLWARMAHLAPSVVNRLARLKPIARISKRLAGIEPDRPIPWFASKRFTDEFQERDQDSHQPAAHGDVLLWPDTFTNNFHPNIAHAAREVLEDAGYHVIVPDEILCCGLTWISTGQLPTAKRILTHTAAALAPLLKLGIPLVSLEPSCTAVFRSDAPDLCPDDPNIELLKTQTRTLAELLSETDGWNPPHIDGAAVVQPHCHQHAVLGFDADQQILERAGVHAETIGGCCGLAGNFGFETGHLDVSVTCAEQELLPAVRGAASESFVLADGFSCRTQLDQTGEGRRALHLAELLAAGLATGRDEIAGTKSIGVKPERPGTPRFSTPPEASILKRPGPVERIAPAVLDRARHALPAKRLK